MRLFLLLFIMFSQNVFAQVLVQISTNKGNIILSLDDEKAPITTANFLKYVRAGFYTDTVFHRVINGFVIQGGGYSLDLTEKYTQNPIANEAHNGLKNNKYTIAMARTNNPHSATSQFFINLADNPHLNQGGMDNYGYAVFGKVIKGFDVVDKIARISTTTVNGVGNNVPTEAVQVIEIKEQEQK